MVAVAQRGSLPPPPPPAGARAFTFGRPATWVESVGDRLVSMLDLFRVERHDDRPPLLPSIARLLGWIVLGIGATAGCAVALTMLVARSLGGVLG